MGLISFGKNFVVEFVGSDKLEFPLELFLKSF